MTEIPDEVIGTLRMLWVTAVEEWFDDPSDGAESFRDLEKVGRSLFEVPDLLAYAREHMTKRGEVAVDYEIPHPTQYEVERAERILR